MKISWIGLGAIGAEMAKRLLAAGHEVTVYPRGKGLAEVCAAGAQTCDDYAALAAGGELLGLCVYNDAQVREVLFDHGALAALKPGVVLANHTTGSPALAREIGAHAPTGAGVLDAIGSGVYSPDEPDRYKQLVNDLTYHDYFMICEDFDSYAAAQRRVAAQWRDPAAWWRSSIYNTANVSFFSSDRAIADYARLVWGVKPVQF